MQGVAAKAAVELKPPPYELNALEPHMSQVRRGASAAPRASSAAAAVMCAESRPPLAASDRAKPLCTAAN